MTDLDHDLTDWPRQRPPLATQLLRKALAPIFRKGTLELRLPDGQSLRVGAGQPVAGVRIHDWKTVRRLALNPDLALGESYMDESLTMTRGDIYDLLDLCLSNIGTGHGNMLRRWQAAGRRLIRPLLMHNPLARARQNVAHHYDLSDDLYELFLDPERQYSCAYFETPEDDLETAQANKMRRLRRKLRLQPGQRALDIGSGWGGLGLSLARAGADVTGVTLSVEQQKYAAARAAREGLGDSARFLLRDYRLLDGQFDRIVSVGMFEHLGLRHFGEYFRKIQNLLAPDGVALVHTIGNAVGPGAPHPWIRKYIFPGGYIPALSEITPAIEKSGLIITDIEVLQLHYAETLKAWRQRFLARRDAAERLYDARFCRMWEFYLAACEASFRHAGLVVWQIQLAKRVGVVPMTRAYLSQGGAGQEKRAVQPALRAAK